MLRFAFCLSRRYLEREHDALRQRPDREDRHADGEPGRRAVQLGERFPLFPPAATRLDHTISPRLPLFTAQIRLETDGLLPALPIQFTTDAWPTTAAEAFTPFEPAAGYTVTMEDLDPLRRPAKYRRLRASPSRRSLSGHPLSLCAFLETLDLNRDADDRRHSRAELVATHRDVLAQLNLQVTVNGLRFAADPDPHALQNGKVEYVRCFYPLDTGPLVPTRGPHPDAGLMLALPANSTRISEITGRCLLPSRDHRPGAMGMSASPIS